MSNAIEGRCGSCQFRDKSGYCKHEKLAEGGFHGEPEAVDMLIYSYDEGGGFYVGPQFGCVHYVKGENL